MCPNKIALLLGALAAFAAAQETAAVEGVVVNKVTGAGIGGATVRFVAPKASRYEITTDDAGAFRILGVKPGDYNASVEKSGYFPDSEVFALLGDRPPYHVSPSGDPLHLRLELNPPAVLRGRALGADGNPARAFIDLGIGRTGRTAYTGADGSFVPAESRRTCNPTGGQPYGSCCDVLSIGCRSNSGRVDCGSRWRGAQRL